MVYARATAESENVRPPLTSRQHEVLEYVRRFMTKTGYPPTIREIGAHFDFAPGSVADHLKALERKGYLRRDPSKSRSLQILLTSGAATTKRKPGSSTRMIDRKASNRGRVAAAKSVRKLKSHHGSIHDDGSSPAGHVDGDSTFLIREQLKLYSEDPCAENATPCSGTKTSSSTSTGYEPLASTWDGEDAELLERMLCFYPRVKPDNILDATVNGGRFWRGSQRRVIGMDLEASHCPSLVGNNTCMPFPSHVFDIVVYDPPHIPNQGRDKSKDFNVRFGLVIRSTKENGYSFAHTYPPFLREAYRVLKPEGILFCKISDYIHDHRYQ